MTDAVATENRRSLGHVRALDGLRGLAVLLVVVSHFAVIAPGTRWTKLINGGEYGVDLFFVLSGFLITSLLLGERAKTGRVHISAFYRRRAMRLLPALVVFLVAHVIYATIAHLNGFDERSSVLSVMLYYFNLPHPGQATEGLTHLWSLSVEEQFYLVWPAAVLLLVAFATRRRVSAAVVIAALVAVVAVHRAVLWQHGTAWTTLYTRTDTRADGLLIGALLAWLWVNGRLPRQGLKVAAWIGLAGYTVVVVHGAAPRTLARGGLTVIALLIAAVIAATVETDWIAARAFAIRPLRAVGRVSYGIYIWHLAVFVAVARYATGLSPTERVLLALALTAVTTLASWHLVERPFLRWKDRIQHRERAPA